MAFAVFLTDAAAHDLEDLYDHIAQYDLPEKADHVLAQIERALTSLSEYPDRGTYPKELLALGIREYREVFFKPYRMIYRLSENRVYILLVVDGRRDMQTLLQRRLLES